MIVRAVVQRVHEASVTAGAETTGAIRAGLLVYLGIDRQDADQDAAYLAEKVRYLRIFPDEARPLNRDVVEAGGQVLVVSAFTLQADARKGRRPTLEAALPGPDAQGLYETFCVALSSLGLHVERGRFGAEMQVQSVNDGPVCILLDSRRAF